MPLYVYKREDGSTVEIQHSIHAEALTVCPQTGQTMERVLQAFASRSCPIAPAAKASRTRTP